MFVHKDSSALYDETSEEGTSVCAHLWHRPFESQDDVAERDGGAKLIDALMADENLSVCVGK